MPDMLDILTVREISQLLRIGINGAYQLVRDGTIPSVRVGRQYRVLRRDVLRYLGQTDENHCA